MADFYFKHYDILDLYSMLKRRHPVIKNNSSGTLIDFTETNWKTTNVNGLFDSIFLNNIGWYYGVIGNLHNYKCLIYIFTDKVENCYPFFLNKTVHN